MTYLQEVQSNIQKLTKHKATSYLRGALMVKDGDKKNTKGLQKMLDSVLMWED